MYLDINSAGLGSKLANAASHLGYKLWMWIRVFIWLDFIWQYQVQYPITASLMDFEVSKYTQLTIISGIKTIPSLVTFGTQCHHIYAWNYPLNALDLLLFVSRRRWGQDSFMQHHYDNQLRIPPTVYWGGTHAEGNNTAKHPGAEGSLDQPSHAV